MTEERIFSSLAEELTSVKRQLGELEKKQLRMDRLLAQQSRTITDLIEKIIASRTAGWPDNRSSGSIRTSQGQGLAEAVFAILRAMRRNI
ncbi:MAG: hypothetical protein LW823_02265 [Rickettsiales bacterium]|jgi:hypothetical protein|nr:hypothetical protein [Rickettsiales bacterium]